MIEENEVPRPPQAVRRRSLNSREKTVGALVFISLACGFIGANDIASPELRLVAGALAVGCGGVIARLFPTGGTGAPQ